MVFNVADLFEHAVDEFPDRPALICGDGRLTFAELDARTNRLAHHLIAQGVGPGDHVGVLAGNAMETAESLIAITKVRAVAVNVNYRYTAPEVQYVLENGDAVVLLYQRGLAAVVEGAKPDLPLLRHLIEIDDGTGGADQDTGTAIGLNAVDYETALDGASPERDFGPRSPDDIYLTYTGGTTGRPKGVMWRHEDIWRTLGGGVDFMSGEEVPDEWHQARVLGQFPLVRMCIAPLIHGQAQWAMFGALFCANTVVLMPKFDAVAVWEAIEREKVNVIALVGDAMARPMIEEYQRGNYDASSLVAISSTAALMSAGVKVQYLEAFPNALLTDAIGSTETGFNGIGVVTKDAMTPRGPKVNAHREAIIIDDADRPIERGSGLVGRLARGGHGPIGYYKDPEKTAKLFVQVDGKRYTVPGDLATYADDGGLVLLGRGDQCINTGGEKVYPEEVESALKGHPGVFDALVIGVPDDRMGRRVAAVVEWREGHEPDVAGLDTFGRTQVAGYKMPRSYWWTPSIERLATGKANYPWARKLTEEQAPDVELSSKVVG